MKDKSSNGMSPFNYNNILKVFKINPFQKKPTKKPPIIKGFQKIEVEAKRKKKRRKMSVA